MTVRDGDLSGQADTLALFAMGGGVQPYVMLIPSGALTDIPGYGFDMAGRALSFGRVPLADISVENMLGVRVDHTAVLDQSSLAALVDSIGGIDVSVKDNLFSTDAEGRLVPVFSAGPHHMNGKTAQRYLAYQGSQESELSRLDRQQQIWEAIFTRGRSGALAKSVAKLGDKVDGDVTPADAASFLGAFAAFSPGQRTYDDLPVSQAGGGDQQAFKVNDADVDQQVMHFLDGLRTWTVGLRPRLQLLNGNGVPEVGATVASKLVPAGFHVVDTGNSRTFDYATTKILVYENDASAIQLARTIRRLLGVGEIEMERRPQTGIDVTVVMGRDLKP
jgi:LCP family protein required for cell wall assembly